MGAKQSKRSVDISGKEAESAGEVAAAGAGGEGRVEALADADALKPQLNGDAHIHDQDKEKQLDSGTPENEKDATTEKENKEIEEDSEKEKDKAVAPVTNGDSEPKAENGDSPAPEDGKKPKKEKVKKKWSLRSISFSRKDKPKQEKKSKEEEPKTNGEPEKVPEEAAEVTPENAANEVAEGTKVEPIKEEKTPETPVTEPLTNGSSTPESAKAESPAVEEPPTEPVTAPTVATAAHVVEAPAPASPVPVAPESDRKEPKAEVQPEQLPINGLSLEEPKAEAPAPQSEESKPEEPTAVPTTETAPAPEIPVKKEVCVEQMPLESTPPPLPANPPPSSVASFAATTMAPELTDASLANTADLVISAPSTVPDTDVIKVDAPDVPASLANLDNCTITETVITELPPPLKDVSDTTVAEIETLGAGEQVEIVQPEIQKPHQPDVEAVETELALVELEVQLDVEKVESDAVQAQADIVTEQLKEEEVKTVAEQVQPEILKLESDLELVQRPTEEIQSVLQEAKPESNLDNNEGNKETIKANPAQDVIEIKEDIFQLPEIETIPAPPPVEVDSESVIETLDNIEDLPPPPPPVEEEIPSPKEVAAHVNENIDNARETTVTVNSNHVASENIEIDNVKTEQLNGNADTEQENIKNKSKDLLDNVIEAVECNGNVEESRKDETTVVAGESAAPHPAAPSPPPLAPAAALPPPPAAPLDSQEPIPVSDKLADLIPEVPVVPELNTETLQETSTDVAVAN